jgi:dTMP kinase
MIAPTPSVSDREAALTAHNYPGRLIIVEGVDGSGKSTQIRLLERWLRNRGYQVYFTEWNSADLVKKTTKKGKKKRSLTPTTFSLLHATDFAHRLVSSIIPPLKAGMMVLADRYVYTAFARDSVRGCDPEWVRRIYRFAPRPDVAFHFKVPIDEALRRLTMSRQVLKEFEAGMDLNLHADPYESFRIFQGRVAEEYERMAAANGFVVMDATQSIPDQQRRVREIVQARLGHYSRRPRIA